MKNKYTFYNRINELKVLLDTFEQVVIQQHKTLSYIIRGNKEIGKTRLIEEFIRKIEGVEYLSEIPNYNAQKHVIIYKCEKENNQPYKAFINITREIYNKTRLINIIIKLAKVGLSIFGINDVLDALNDFNKAINKGDRDEKRLIKEAKLFNKYRKFLKTRSRKAPIIIFIQNTQWIDTFSLTLIKKIIKKSSDMWGMIILEEDNDSIEEEVHNELNNLIFENKLHKLDVNLLDNSFPNEFLKNRFGKDLFSAKEIDLLYAVSEGCPGKLINYIEQTCMPQGWIKWENNDWIKVNDFYEKIKPVKQRLTDVIISMYEDKILSESEHNTLLHMASVWGMQKNTVDTAVTMIKEIIEYDYKIISNLGPGIIAENSFLVSDKNDHRYIIEYIRNFNKEVKIIDKRTIVHKNLFEAHEIKISKEGILLIWDYFESNPNRREMIEAFENQINYNIEKFRAIGEGLSELHRNNIFHGYIKPETIIENKNGEFQLASFDNRLLKYILNPGDENYPDIQYLSPEHLNNKKISMSSDIFSLGILLYKSLTNQFPFYGNTKADLMHSFKNDDIKYNRPFLALIPNELKMIIKKCLEYSPEKRYKNAMEFIDDLTKVPVKKIDKQPSPSKKPAHLIQDNEKKNKQKTKVTSRMIFAIIIALLIIITSSYYFGLFRTKSIKNEIVIHVVTKNLTTDTNAIISSGVIQYLIMNDLMRSSNAIVKTQQQFDKSYPDNKSVNFIPEIKVNLTLTNRTSFSHEINFDITRNSKNGSSVKKQTIDFSDPSELLKGNVNAITKLILGRNTLNRTKFTNSWDAFKRFYKGEIAWSKVDPNPALGFFNAAVGFDSNFILAKLRLSEIYRFNGNNHQSIKNLQSVLPYTKYLGKIDSLKTMALQNKLKGNFLAVINNLRDATQYLSTSKNPYYDLAEAYFEIRDISDAKINYHKALDLDPDFISAINHYAYCFTQTGNHKQALKYFRKYLKLDSSANAFNSYGDGLMAAGLLDSAEWAQKQGLKIDSELVYLYSSLSYIHVRKGEFDSAEMDINHYLQNDPELKANGLVNKALIYYFRGNLNMALDTCKKALSVFDTLDISTRNHKAHWLLTQIYLYTNDTADANIELKQMDSLIRQYHISSTIYNEIFKFYLHCKAIKYSIHHNDNEIKKIANIFNSEIKDKIKDWSSPYDQAFFFTEFGKLFLINNDYTDAKKELQLALAYNPNYALAHYYLYKLFLKLKDYKEANGNANIFLKRWSEADKNIIYIKDTLHIQKIKIPDIELNTDY